MLSFHPALLWKLCLGECCPPSSNFSQKPHALYPHHAHTHTHTRTAEVCRPTCLIPALSHPYCTYSETQPLTHSNPTHPLIPPSFFRFPLGWLNLAIAARIHPQQRMVSLKTCTITTTLSPPLSLLLAGLQHMKRTKKCEDNLIQEASRLSDPGAAGHAPNLKI